MMVRNLVTAFLLLSVALVVTIGCGESVPTEKELAVKGKVTNKGQPLLLDPKLAAVKAARVELRFTRIGGGQEGMPTASETAFAQPDGTFQAKLPAGKYRIGVKHINGGDDELKGKFDERKSPIEREITTDGQELNIELSNPTGK